MAEREGNTQTHMNTFGKELLYTASYLLTEHSFSRGGAMGQAFIAKH